jgi:hypothetical protein
MVLDILVLMYPALFLLPIVLYYASVRPKLRKSVWPAYLVGGAMVVSSFLPFAGMPHMNYLIPWIAAVGVLLLVSIAVWMSGALKQKQEFVAGPIMTALTVMVSGVIIGNWLSVILSIVFFAVIIRNKQKLFSN